AQNEREVQQADELQVGGIEEPEVILKRGTYGSSVCRQGRDLITFGATIAVNAGVNPLRFNGHGRYCGITSPNVQGSALDNLDECCRIHDQCYGYAVDSQICHPASPYIRPYFVIYRNGNLICPHPRSVLGNINLNCGTLLCQCDV
ncbi:phospholipase A2 family protein, partial [Salmonella sp. s51933]|uniref:phospholipase A2 family protein n=1 Tax=Salmonella sp. s51933 TaxID=3160127 RepID=UPI0037546116